MLQDDFLEELDAEHAFGALLTTLRSRVKGKKVKQKDIVARLPGWTVSSYSRLENGELAPRFDQLLPLYHALRQAGVSFSRDARQQFVDLARRRISVQKTHKDIRADAEWAQLRFELARLDSPPEALPNRPSLVARPLLAETSHLVGREQWREELIGVLNESHRKKLVVVRGPTGIGKSSELNWLATHLFHLQSPAYQVILCDFRSGEHLRSPEDALDILLGTIMVELGSTLPQTFQPSFEERTVVVLEQLEQAKRPVVVLVDHGECLLREQGELAPCWERFLSRFLRSQHHTLFVLATKQWPGWFGGEQLFITEIALPPLSQEKAILLLQQLGLEAVPVALLRQAYEHVGGIPLCLEWVAALVKQPLHADDWEEFDSEGQDGILPSDNDKAHDIAHAFQYLLAEPHVFGGNLSEAVAPLLDRIANNQCLSADARSLLHVLSVAAIPLAKPALEVLCPAGPRPIKELRRASLLVAYEGRVQLLPMVAAAVLRSLSPEQVQEREEILLRAYKAWLEEGLLHEGEGGAVVTELAVILLKHQCLLEAAQLLIRFGWLSFRLGHATRLARLAANVMQRSDLRATVEGECGGLLLHYFLSPYLGRSVDARKRVEDYYHIRDAVLAGKVVLQPPIEVAITHHLMLDAMDKLRFQEAQALLDACCTRLESLQASDADLQASLLEKRALLFRRWSEYAEEQAETETASKLQEQAIAIYRQSIALLSASRERSSLKRGFLKKRLARALNNLGYHLNRIGQYEEALQLMEESIALKEEGYAEVDTLATAYGEKSQILASLGRFQEALEFDEKALSEVQRLANAGFTFAQEDVWMYLVNRGHLYLRLGRVHEAEHLLREALPHIQPGRRMYRVFAQDALTEIEQWRLNTASPHYQLDWRWVERYRALASFDSYWWLAAAGPFTSEEQRQWDQMSTASLNEVTKEQMGMLLAQSRDRELETAIAEQREPHLSYPTIDIGEVKSRIAGLLELQSEINQRERNAVVRRLYVGTIEEELWFLRLIEATYEGDNERFWKCNLRLNPVPTLEEMEYALSRVRHYVLQGLLRPEVAEVSQQVIQFLREHLGLSLDLSYDEKEAQELQEHAPLSPSQPQLMVSPQAVKRFFEAALQQSGYEGWRVMIDPNASDPRVEQGLRYVYLPERPLSVQQIKHYVSHELAGHIARCIAGERSPLGLLGIHTEHSLETEEGLATYYDRQMATLAQQAHDESAIWFGTLATSFASGVGTPPQTFISLFTFFELLIMLYRLLRRPDQDTQTAKKQARKFAIARCLRTYRGVPDLKRAGICYTKDALYLRGLWKIEKSLAQDETVLDRLAVGVVALEHLPDLQELGIVSYLQPLRRLVQDPELDAYILSFERPDEHLIEQQ